MYALRLIPATLLFLVSIAAIPQPTPYQLEDPDRRLELYGFSVLPLKGTAGWFMDTFGARHRFLFRRDLGPKAANEQHTAVAAVKVLWLQGCEDAAGCLQRGIEENRSAVDPEGMQTVVSLEVSREDVPHQNCVRFTGVEEDRRVPGFKGQVFEERAAGLLCTHPDEPRLFLIFFYSERFKKGGKPVYSLAEEAKSFLQSLRFEPIGPRVAWWVKPGPFTAGITVGGDRLWVQHRSNVSRIDIESGRPIQTFSSGADGWALAYGAGALWVGHEQKLTRVDPDKGTVVATIPLPGRAVGITEAFGSIWALVIDNGVVARIDPRTNALIAEIPTAKGIGSIAAGHGSVWASSEDGHVHRIDPDGNKVVARIRVCSAPVGVVATQKNIWIACSGSGNVVSVDPTTGEVTKRVSIGSNPLFVDADAQALWVTQQHGAVSRLDLETHAVTTTIPIGIQPFAVRAAFDSIWITDPPTGKLFRIRP